MRAIGLIEDGHAFLEPELARGTPRFWWSAARKAAYAAALARWKSQAEAPAAPAPAGAGAGIAAAAVASGAVPGTGGDGGTGG